jgi:hypothetical protein
MIRNLARLRTLPILAACTPSTPLLPHSHAALPFNGNAWTSPAWSKLTRNAFAFSDQKDNRNSDEEKRSKEEKEE